MGYDTVYSIFAFIWFLMNISVDWAHRYVQYVDMYAYRENDKQGHVSDDDIIIVSHANANTHFPSCSPARPFFCCPFTYFCWFTSTTGDSGAFIKPIKDWVRMFVLSVIVLEVWFILILRLSKNAFLTKFLNPFIFSCQSFSFPFCTK